MEIIQFAELLTKKISSYKGAGKTIGFVPTMGALHRGHLSLLHACKEQNDISVVSIFVNPTQFNDQDDLKNYPRNLTNDLILLRKEKCNLVFCPDEKEMYPVPDTRKFDFGGLDRIMEGLHRPGHFNGVAQIVTRLLDIIIPHRIYLGMKDFQQIAIIRKVIHDFGYPAEVVTCPTVREDDGLALSSRNMLLSKEQRQIAEVIPRTLFEAKELMATGKVSELKKTVIDKINNNPELNVEYFEIVDKKNLQPVKDFSQKGDKIGCIAVKIGNIRLIDNVCFS